MLNVTSTRAAIGDAVDSPSLGWGTGGDANWFDQAVVTQDGVDAAQSGAIFDNQQTSIQTPVTGPGVLVFWWKTSSELDFDYLNFYTNGVPFVDPVTLEVLKISGDTAWERNVCELPAGNHTLRWTYEKDETVLEGLDLAWLDQVQFYTDAIPPIITAQPDATTTATVGGPAVFAVTAVGTAPLSYQWRRDGVDLLSGGRIAGAQASLMTLDPLLNGDAGAYDVVIINSFGSVTSAPTVLYTFDQVLDTTALTWSSGGDAPWQGQTGMTHDGVDAAISGSITNDEISWVQATAMGPGSISFWWKVDSEVGLPGVTGDGMELFLDGVLQKSLSGPSIAWTNEIVTLTDGPHSVEWRYSKDNILFNGEDRGWLDQVSYTFSGTPPFTLSPGGFSGGLFQITLQGEANQLYRLYSSSNLLDWVPVQTNSDPSGVVFFTDPSGTGYSHRYYRAEGDPN